MPIVGVGGIFTADDAYERIRSGAALVQVYTALIYEGPGWFGTFVRACRTARRRRILSNRGGDRNRCAGAVRRLLVALDVDGGRAVALARELGESPADSKSAAGCSRSRVRTWSARSPTPARVSSST